MSQKFIEISTLSKSNTVNNMKLMILAKIGASNSHILPYVPPAHASECIV
jgi:hypothetical protein